MSLKRVCDKCNKTINQNDKVHIEIQSNRSTSFRDYHINCFEKLIKANVYNTFKIKEANNDNNKV